MTEKLKAYLDGLFESVPDTKEVREAKDELYDGMIERYEDCLREGMDEQAAYDCVVDSIGDIRELIDELDTSGEPAGGQSADAGERGKTKTDKSFDLDDLIQTVTGFAQRMVSGADKVVNGVVDWINDPVMGDLRLVNSIRLPLADVDSIDIDYISDSVRLRHGEGDELVINEYMNRDDPSLYAQVNQGVGNIEVRHGKRVGIFVLYSRIEVLLPASWYGSLSLSTVSGRIVSEDSWKLVSLNAKTVSGEVDLRSVVAGMVRASSTSGTLRLQFAEGEMDLHTVSGAIRADAIRGSGSFATTSGGIRVGFEQLNGNVKASTISGGVRLGIPMDANVELDAKSMTGNIHTAFNDTLSYSRRNRVHAFIGSEPYHYVRLNTTSGGIHIND